MRKLGSIRWEVVVEKLMGQKGKGSAAAAEVEMLERLPALAVDPPPARRPFGRKCSVRLWEAARYAVGFPPAAHSALQAMSCDRCWQGCWRPWDGLNEVVLSTLPPAVASQLRQSGAPWSCRISPPTAEMRMHQPEAGNEGWMLWQIEGQQQAGFEMPCGSVCAGAHVRIADVQQWPFRTLTVLLLETVPANTTGCGPDFSARHPQRRLRVVKAMKPPALWER
eukprot:Skav225200  [mRNA]  locus=scaffold785:17142:23902:- [translate_table: standard]